MYMVHVHVRMYVCTFICTRKKVSLRLLCGVQHSLIMADFFMHEVQQPITTAYVTRYIEKKVSL